MAHESTSQEILEKMGQGVIANAVKKVQRGTIAPNTAGTGKMEYPLIPGSYTTAHYIDVTLSAVDVNKTFTNVKEYTFEYRDSGYEGLVWTLLNSTTLRIFYYITPSNTSGVSSVDERIFWEVVEFY
jgi:hypothetical protein